MLHVPVMVIPLGREVTKTVVAANAGHRYDPPLILRSEDDRRPGVDIRRSRFLQKRFVRRNARIASLGLHARHPDHQPAPAWERDGLTARAVVDQRVPFSILVWT
jgi:hypothetical protein